jgi:hypothetical protein
MNGDEVVEFEFGYGTPFVAEMPDASTLLLFFYKVSISGVFLSAVFLITRTRAMTNGRTIWGSMEGGAA